MAWSTSWHEASHTVRDPAHSARRKGDVGPRTAPPTRKHVNSDLLRIAYGRISFVIINDICRRRESVCSWLQVAKTFRQAKVQKFTIKICLTVRIFKKFQSWVEVNSNSLLLRVKHAHSCPVVWYNFHFDLYTLTVLIYSDSA